jgi:hypothetical protein
MNRKELAEALNRLKTTYDAIISSKAWLDLKTEESRRNGPNNLKIRDSTEIDIQDQHDSFLTQLTLLRQRLIRDPVHLSAEDQQGLETEMAYMEKEVAGLDLGNRISRADLCW